MEWSRYVYLAGIVLALVLVIPTAWFPFQLAKIAVFALVLIVAMILFAAGGGAKELLRAHGFKLAALTALLPLSYLVSYLFAADKTLSIIGSNAETDTVVFAVVACLAFLASFVLFRTLRTVSLLLKVVFVTLVVAVVFQWILVIFGTSLIPFQIFSDRSINLIGKWNDLGILVSLLGMFILVRAELTRSTMLWRGIWIAGLVALAVLLGIINFAVAWGFVLVFSIVLAAIKFLTQKVEEPAAQDVYAGPASRSMIERMPWFAIAGAVVAILFLFFGSSLNAALTNIFPVSSLEVRPSYASTMQIITAARGGSGEHLLVGTGPNTFGDSWLLNKPTEVNQSVFWNLDFNVGFSTFITALGTVGLLGIIAWLVPIILVLAALIRAIRLGVLSRDERIATTTIGIGSLLLFAALIVYVPSQNSVLLALTLGGAAFGFLWRQGRSNQGGEETSPSRMGFMGAQAAMLGILLLALWSGFITTRHLIAQADVGRGAAALQSGNTDDAITFATKASHLEKNSDALRLAVTAGTTKLQTIASTQTAPSADVQTQFTNLTQQVVVQGQDLAAQYPTDYRSHLLLGQVYDLLASLKIAGAYEKAAESYTNAQKYNPTNPQIPLMLARLEATQANHAPQVQKYLTQSLTLKSNYTDAILFLVQLNVANNDLPNAIKAAQAAVQSAPGVASIWFELGLLYYSGGDTKNAIQPLEQSITLVPDYANAKYFLGLSYAAQSRSADAIKQFEDLAKSNPDSAEVQTILANLRAGKAPFDGAVPPATTPPQDRTTAPINQ
ncbi:MAG TPA: tetratricopeptide repeat protein [Candidatus Paceibacterota bacterium]|nr:tetratricopeptide repeat protein [Candidatus Paceibacterota bacterium]